MMDALLRKYRDGRVSAADVCDALRALKAQNMRPQAEQLLLGCLAAVDPVPTTLWAWACTNVDFFHCNTLRGLLAVADRSPRYQKHLRREADKWTSTIECVVALLYESSTIPWTKDLANRGVDVILSASPRRAGVDAATPGSAAAW